MSSPTRIAFCITDLDPGGAERALVQLVTRLDRSRWEPAVFCLAPPGALVEPLQQAGISPTCLGAHDSSDWLVIPRLSRQLKTFHPEIVQTFLFHANLAGRIAGRWAGVRRIVSGIRVAERRTRRHLWLDRLTNGLVRCNICVSQAVADYSANVAGLHRDKLVVISNGVSVETFATAQPLDFSHFNIPAGARVLVSVGRLDPQKGLLDLLGAAQSVTARHSDVHFLLVGEGPERPEIERRISMLGLAGQVHLAGWRSDIPQILRAATALVLPSLWEGMPNVVLEAMAAALPVVATRVEGTAELVLEDKTGFLSAPAAPAELTAAIEKVMADPVRARHLGLAGQTRVREHFSWDAMVAHYDELYRRILTSP